MFSTNLSKGQQPFHNRNPHSNAGKAAVPLLRVLSLGCIINCCRLTIYGRASVLSAVCPKPWEKTFVSFEDTYFMKAKVRTFNHIPIDFGVDQGGPYCHRQG